MKGSSVTVESLEVELDRAYTREELAHLRDVIFGVTCDYVSPKRKAILSKIAEMWGRDRTFMDMTPQQRNATRRTLYI